MTKQLTPEQEADCLALNPFDMDFGSPGDRIFSDRIAVARKVGPCHICTQLIQPGEAIRRHVGLYDDRMQTYRWCRLCCGAMALSWTDDSRAIEERFKLRRCEVTSK